MHGDVVEILYEDEALVAVNKPARLLVHPGRDADRSSLQKLMEERLGRDLVLFHRLDKDTTGVVLLGKQRSINAEMAAAFANKRIRKAYWAVVAGRWKPEWNRIETQIARGEDGRYRNVVAGGRVAISTCRLLSASDEKSWIEVLPKTGRTHQVRLHCLAMGHPILGDRIYGERSETPHALHAWRIDFRHPVSGEPIQIRAAAPGYWEAEWLGGLEIRAEHRRLVRGLPPD
jgi:RluA family pseudouridine synthase